MKKALCCKKSGNARCKALSFVSGLAISCVIVGVVVAKNPDIKAEIESQGRQALQITKNMLARCQNTIRKLQNLATALSEDPSLGTEDEQTPSPEALAYNAQWDAVGK
jgi:hypothetical protein